MNGIRKLTALALALCLAVSLMAGVSAAGPAPAEEGFFPTAGFSSKLEKVAEMIDGIIRYFFPLTPRYSDVPYAGQLSIPGVGIQVDCYKSNAQYVGDRADSACFFRAYPFSGTIICDHSDQTFAPLTKVKPGETATLRLPDGSAANMVCMEAFYGRNTGSALTNSKGGAVPYYYDFVMYTCASGGIYLCFWSLA